MNVTRKLWAAGDGNGGYDIGEGDITVASVRNIKLQDGYRVAKAYEAQQGREFDPRELAVMFKESPAMVEVIRELVKYTTAMHVGAHKPEDAIRLHHAARAILERIA